MLFPKVLRVVDKEGSMNWVHGDFRRAESSLYNQEGRTTSCKTHNRRMMEGRNTNAYADWHLVRGSTIMWPWLLSWDQPRIGIKPPAKIQMYPRLRLPAEGFSNLRTFRCSALMFTNPRSALMPVFQHSME
jgi:hypothetical protein